MELAIEYGLMIILEQPCSFHTIQNSAFIAVLISSSLMKQYIIFNVRFFKSWDFGLDQYYTIKAFGY